MCRVCRATSSRPIMSPALSDRIIEKVVSARAAAAPSRSRPRNENRGPNQRGPARSPVSRVVACGTSPGIFKTLRLAAIPETRSAALGRVVFNARPSHPAPGGCHFRSRIRFLPRRAAAGPHEQNPAATLQKGAINWRGGARIYRFRGPNRERADFSDFTTPTPTLVRPGEEVPCRANFHRTGLWPPRRQENTEAPTLHRDRVGNLGGEPTRTRCKLLY